MRILKHGDTNRIGKCYWCDCIFEYGLIDINKNDRTVKCPECGLYTDLDNIGDISSNELDEVLK